MSKGTIWDRPAWASVPSDGGVGTSSSGTHQRRQIGERVQALYKNNGGQFYEAVVTNVEPLTVKYCGYGNEAVLELHEVKTPPPLPDGTTAHTDASTGYPYWVDSSGASTWDRPRVRVTAKTVLAATKFKKAFAPTPVASTAHDALDHKSYSQRVNTGNPRLVQQDLPSAVSSTSSRLREPPHTQASGSSSKWKPNTVAKRKTTGQGSNAANFSEAQARSEKNTPESTGATVARRLLGPSSSAASQEPAKPRRAGGGSSRAEQLDREINAAKMIPGAFGVNTRGRRVGLQPGCACGC